MTNEQKKTLCRAWVYCEPSIIGPYYTLRDRVHGYSLGTVRYEGKRWALKPRKRLASMQERFHRDIADLLVELNSVRG